ncbi:MAG TPA: HAD-IIIC family phosphatase [Pyrinomonadaceae bacterium]|jgi:FkbH-like protein|nr:HAD-IIIC family phosphatase [Pyrinomonadaceae bacterium]
MAGTEKDGKVIKCVVWDLDHTLWDGVLLEDERVTLREDAAAAVRALDARGILQSVASKNEHGPAMAKLREFGLAEYFLYPQVNWNSKAASIKAVAEALNIGRDAVAFLDDQPFERGEVEFSLPEVLCLDPADLRGLLDRPEFRPRFITEDSRLRRAMYLSDFERKQAAEAFAGTADEFLATLGMQFTIGPAGREDLRRAEELTVRTNQLNSTGTTYSYDELAGFVESDRHLLLIAGLTDKYGTYGKIGLALVECGEREWTLKLLLMSCRVISRGVGTIMMNHIMRLAKEAGVALRAEFVPNGRNRMMYVTYKFANFREAGRSGDTVILENDLSRVQGFPDYVRVEVAGVPAALAA